MNLNTFCFASAVALLSTGVHAQSCSGGTGGGADATGNDCGLEVEVRMVPIASAKMMGMDVTAMKLPAAATSAKMKRGAKAAPSTLAAAEPPRNRIAATQPAPAEPMKTAKVVPGPESGECSSGAAGMDATGNECNAAAILAARVR